MGNRKMWMQLLMVAIAAIWAALTDDATRDRIVTQEWIVIGTMFVGAFGVQIVPNMEVGIARYAKTVVSILTAVLPVLGVLILGGLTQAEVLELIIVGAGAVGLVAGVGNPGYVFARKSVSQMGATGGTAGSGF